MVNEYFKRIESEIQYPIRHRRKVPFDPSIQVAADFSRKAMDLRRLDSELDRFILRAEDYLDLVVDSYTSNIHQSTKLEGNPLPLEEVRRLTRNSFEGIPHGPLSEPRQEILNHIVSWVRPEAFTLPWTMPKIQGVHQTLLRGVADEKLVGKLRDFDSEIHEGEVVYFIPTPHKHVPEELQALLDWVNRNSSAFHPVVAATLMFHEFESIHPFADGNGRVGRTLFHIYLQNYGLPNAHLCNIQEELLRDTSAYYTLLGWADSTGGYLELMDYVMDGLLRSYSATRSKLMKKDLLSSNLDETAKRLLTRAKHKGDWFRVSEACEWVHGRGEQTVRKRLAELKSLGALEAQGRTRSLRFRFFDPFAEVKAQARAQVEALQAQTPTPPGRDGLE